MSLLLSKSNSNDGGANNLKLVSVDKCGLDSNSMEIMEIIISMLVTAFLEMQYLSCGYELSKGEFHGPHSPMFPNTEMNISHFHFMRLYMRQSHFHGPHSPMFPNTEMNLYHFMGHIPQCSQT